MINQLNDVNPMSILWQMMNVEGEQARISVVTKIHLSLDGTTGIEHVHKSKRSKTVSSNQNLNRRNSKHLVFQHLEGHRQSHIVRKNNGLPRVVRVERAITVPILVSSSLRDEVDVATSDVAGNGGGIRLVEGVLPLGGAPRSTLAIIHSEHPTELVHVPYLEQTDSIAGRIGEQAVLSGPPRETGPKHGPIR
ncbi:hypothetical protein CR513_28647, partial [Mucuna pruriens]